MVEVTAPDSNIIDQICTKVPKLSQDFSQPSTLEELLPPRPPETKEVIESKLIPCERCGTVVAMLIFAPNATDAGHLEDYARKMYPHYNHLNVPTWIIGPALGEGPLINRPADVLKVWPAREPIQRLPPAQFNSLLDQFVTRHCH